MAPVQVYAPRGRYPPRQARGRRRNDGPQGAKAAASWCVQRRRCHRRRSEVTGRPFDVSPDGRFLVIKDVTDPANRPAVVAVFNWFEELIAKISAAPSRP